MDLYIQYLIRLHGVVLKHRANFTFLHIPCSHYTNHKSKIHFRYIHYIATDALHTHSVNGMVNVIPFVRTIPGSKIQKKFI
jgi:hypothetical protein